MDFSDDIVKIVFSHFLADSMHEHGIIPEELSKRSGVTVRQLRRNYLPGSGFTLMEKIPDVTYQELLSAVNKEHLDFLRFYADHKDKLTPRKKIINYNRPKDTCIGREEDIDRITETLLSSSDVLLYGVAGVGKTLLANSVLKNIADNKLDAGVWDGLLSFDFSQSAQISVAIDHFLRLVVPESIKIPIEGKNFFLANELTSKRYIIFLDNIELAKSDDDINGFIENFYACFSSQTLLVASQSKAHQPSESIIENLEAFNPSGTEAREILAHYYDKKLDACKVTEDICKLLGGLPLALRTVGKFIKNTPTITSLNDYYALVYKDNSQFWPSLKNGSGFMSIEDQLSQSILAAHNLAESKYEPYHDPHASVLQILAVAAKLAYKSMSISVFREVLGERIDFAMHALFDYGLIIKGDNTEGEIVFVHAIIHRYAANFTLDEHQLEKLVHYYLELLQDKKQTREKHWDVIEAIRDHVCHLIASIHRDKNLNQTLTLCDAISDHLNYRSSWSQLEEIREYALWATENFGDTKQQAAQHGELGMILDQRGAPDRAERHYLKSLKLYKKLGERDQVARRFSNLGTLYDLCNDPTQASSFLMRALEIYEELDHQEGIALAQNNIGLLHYDKGIKGEIRKTKSSMEEAKKCFEIAEEIYNNMGNEEGLARVKNNLGLIALWHGKKKDYALAKKLFSEADMHNKSIGNDAARLESLSNLGFVDRHLEKYDEALESHQNALKIAEKIGDYDRMALNLFGMGDIFLMQEKLVRADEKYLEAENKHKAIALYGGQPRSEAIANIKANRGIVRKAQKSFEEARELFMEAREIYKKIGAIVKEKYMDKQLKEIDRYT